MVRAYPLGGSGCCHGGGSRRAVNLILAYCDDSYSREDIILLRVLWASRAELVVFGGEITNLLRHIQNSIVLHTASLMGILR